jgi:site-specific DNA-methyltransferase (adenine-specific)
VNKLYYGDNLDILRNKVTDESVDLIYLDPPFKSGTNYNVLFQEAGDDAADAQLEAFKDTWQWGPAAEAAYDDVRNHGKLGLALGGLRRWLGDRNSMMAYLAMMSVRLVELQKKLKQGGSIYLHCDPTASHYLKILMDALFGHGSFRNEITWCYRKWSVAAGQFVRNHDVILFYSNGPDWTFNVQYIDPSAGTQKRWKGKKQLAIFDEAGTRQASSTDEEAQTPCPDWWEISIINPNAAERLGYPTQKPLKLLERIISASSNPGDVVLDPFCGCGTAVDAAEKLGREWVGVDIAHYAVTLIEERLARWRAGAQYEVYGRPTTLAGAHDLAERDKYQFQWWASWLLGAQSYSREEVRGADGGIDGRIAYKNGPYGDGLIIISVKGGANVGVQMVRDLRGVIEREEAEMGVLITLAEPTGPMVTEAARAGFVRESAHGRLPRLQVVTVADLLDGRLPQMPPIPRPERRTSSRRKTARDQLELLLPVSGDEVSPQIKGDFIDPRYMRFGRKARQSITGP